MHSGGQSLIACTGIRFYLFARNRDLSTSITLILVELSSLKLK
jgi:hypothetical protein